MLLHNRRHSSHQWLSMNELFVTLGIESWKPVLGNLLLPPVPLLLLVLVGTRMIAWRRAVGWSVVLLSVLGQWLGTCSASGEWLQRQLLSPPPPLGVERIAELRRAASGPRPTVAIVVLGGGRESLAPEYRVANLSPQSLARLRYGVWLARETGAPLAFSGGLGHAAQGGAAAAAEAEVAADIAAREYARPLRWVEARSRDTRENGVYTAQTLQGTGVRQVVLVTNGWHMPRALRAFRDAAAHDKLDWEVVPAPMGLASRIERPALRWMPSSEGFRLVRDVLHEKIGWWLGA